MLQLNEDTISFTFGTRSEIHGLGLPPVKVTLYSEVLGPDQTRLHLHKLDMPQTRRQWQLGTSAAAKGGHTSC